MRARSSYQTLVLAVASMAVALTAGPAAADTVIRTIERSFDVTEEHVVVLDVPIGEIHVEPGSRGRVEVEVIVSCGSRSSRCRERAEEVELDDSLRRRSLSLEISGQSNKLTSRPSLEVHLRLPAASGLEIDLGVGEIDVSGLRGDLEIDLGVGEVRISADEDVIGSVELAAGVGDVDLRPRRSSQSDSGFLFLGNELYWGDGPGEAHLSVDVGVGDAQVTLE